MQVIVAHPGTQYSHQLAVQLEKRQLLAGFHTGLALAEDGLAATALELLPAAYRNRLANRRIRHVPAKRIQLYPTLELAALVRQRWGSHSEEVLHWRNEHFQRAIPQRSIESADAVIGFDTSSWILAQRCLSAGKPLVLDQSIGHPDSKARIYEKVNHDFPEWAASLTPRLPVVREAEQIEHCQARLVIAASTFTQRTLIENGVDPRRICLNPYGVDSARFKPNLTPRAGPLRFIFVGSLTSRKGVPLLLRAWQELKPANAELWLVGPVSASVRQLIPVQKEVRVVGSVPHGQIPTLLQQCDVFVFPSYFEGFGLVLLEAMACCLPVISTTATAAPDIDPDRAASWITEPGDLAGLTAAMEQCLADPDVVQRMGTVARQIAERNSWNEYGKRWATILQTLQSGESN